MNKIIVLCLITLSLAITEKGPAHNLKYPDSEKLCGNSYIYDYDYNGDHNILYWADENPGVSEKPNSGAVKAEEKRAFPLLSRDKIRRSQILFEFFPSVSNLGVSQCSMFNVQWLIERVRRHPCLRRIWRMRNSP